MSDTSNDRPDLIAPPPLIYAGALAIGWLLQRLMPIDILPRRPARALGAGLIGLNFLVGVPAFLAMRRARTAVNPMRPTTAIVTAGPYRYTRNPIYLSFAVLYTGIALLANAVWALLFLPGVLVAVTRGVIEREERYLEGKFGAEYTDYKARVRRWI